MADITRSTQLTVSTTAVNVSKKVANDKRIGISLRNSSTGGQVLSITESNNDIAVAGNGIVLSAGQAFTDFTSEGYLAWQGDITVVSSAAAGVLSVFERGKA